MTVVLVDPRHPSLVPMEAIKLLRDEVQYTEELPAAVARLLPAGRPVHSGNDATVLLSSDPTHPAVTARLAAGDRLISAPHPRCGQRLLNAVAVIDQLRTAGRWEAEQTNDSFRRYLLTETYALLDAISSGDSDQMREELANLLLHVLFHARIAEDSLRPPFTIDDVADALMRKLGNRRAGVLAGESLSFEEQLGQWVKGKTAEKPRSSVMQGLFHHQPALALAQKVIERAGRAGLPMDLIPATITSIVMSPDVDAESQLRTAVLEFMDTVRRIEGAINASRHRPDDTQGRTPLGAITEQEWRAFWPSAGAGPGDTADHPSEHGRDEERGGAGPSPAQRQ
ncbi:Nucleoside triphosphate pyrophosphohydrolase [Mycobacterium basiliense]|uniref:Nucleoside triphosphate pyrophosphohydrolase n=1 Tax=Mycobacterium basiliense TaxID=2094119 RepID=A0A447GBK5_9MYCO|nr:nucleoside triphosphate pyrophosphohydrolase [Mycobacterium basiliense]VDM87835.1 Nucleoside triphosphate pyrophosphohydrolase [Mycobacterium basiliense]